ncbi:hypothetical protein PI124_g19744 [Phytophthora idaei]|nr:hypothetical protein PI126_g19231 [Phytophthora idaei]KAG3235216.1 hypothetical protein PI124_g19744 [Phytophthora idaei]
MLDRYFDIAGRIDHTDRKLLDVRLTPREKAKLESILGWMENLESVNKRLQAGGVGELEASLLDARRLFDAVVKKVPVTSKYLRASAAAVVKSPCFESGVVGSAVGEGGKLKPSEVIALSRLEDTRNDGIMYNEANLSFAKRVLLESNRQPRSRYIDLRWIPSISNEVERLFSRPGLAFSVYRRATHPTALETLPFFLQYNRELWDAQLVAGAVRRDGRHTRQRVFKE